MQARGFPAPMGLVPPLVEHGRVVGKLRPPGSKSLAIRTLVGGSLLARRTRLMDLPGGEDVDWAVRLVGGQPRRDDPRVLLVRWGGAGAWAREGLVSVGESGTLARIVTACCAFGGEELGEIEIRGGGTLTRRRSGPLLDALRANGVAVECMEQEDGWPLRLVARSIPPAVTLRNPLSSQEVSALLFALAHPAGSGGLQTRRLEVQGVIPSRPYVDLTLLVLRGFGVQVEEEVVDGGWTFFHITPGVLDRVELEVEADASLAAVALAAGCLTGGSVEIEGLSSTTRQGDAAIFEHLEAFGCRASRPEGACGRPLAGADLDLGDTPDLAPVLAVVAAGAAANSGEPSLLRGLGTLPGKESDRLAVLAHGLRAAGWDVASETDSLRIGPPELSRTLTPVVLDPRGDHRMAFAFALLGLLRHDVLVADPGCVAKTWPSFWGDMERLGATVRSG